MTYRTQAERTILADTLAAELKIEPQRVAEALAVCERRGLFVRPVHRERI